MPEGARATLTNTQGKVEKPPAEEHAPEERPHPANLHAQILYRQRVVGNQAVQRLIRSGFLQVPLKTKPLSRQQEKEQDENTSPTPLHPPTVTENSAETPSHSRVSPISLRQPNSRLQPTFPKIHSPATHNAAGLNIQRHWYNFDIPFTDYQFDPSLEGLKTAGGLAADKAKQGANFVKDQVVAAAEWVVDKLKSVINSGIEWLTGKFNEIKEFAVSSFADIKGAVRGILGAITNPIGLITNAITLMDAGILSSAWRALTTGASAAWQAVKNVVNGVLKAGGGIWETVSKFVDTLFSTVDDLLDSRAFNLLPDVVQSPIRGLYKTVRDLWTSIRDFWADFWKRLTAFVKDLLDSIQAFVQKVLSYAIDQVIETVKKLKEVYDFIKRFVADPEGTMKPIITSIAAKIKAEAPGKAHQVAQQKSGEAWAKRSSPSSGTVAVHRSPDKGAAIRTTTGREIVDANVNQALADQWASLDIAKMLWDTVVNTFWPPATIRAIGHEFYELWNTDWKNAVDSLYTPRNIFDDFEGFWHDVWSNFLILLDFPLALWRRLNSILTLLMGYVSIILILVGLVGGAIVGNVPGALAGAAAGAQLAWAIGEALFLSFFLAESASALKAFLALYTALQTEQEKQRDYVQIAASVIGIGVAIVLAIVFSLLGALAKEVVGRIKARGGGPPKELPKGKEGTDSEPEKKTEAAIVPGKAELEADIQTAQTRARTLRDAISERSPADDRPSLDKRAADIERKLAGLKEEASNAATADDVQRTRNRLQDAQDELDDLRRDAGAHSGRDIDIDSPDQLRAGQPWYANGAWRWKLFDSVSKAEFCDVSVKAANPSATPEGGPRLILEPKKAVLPDGTEVSLKAKGFSWTPEALKLAMRAFREKFGTEAPELGGEIDWDNLANFQVEYAKARAAQPELSPAEWGKVAAGNISFGKHRITVGYGDLSARMSDFGDVTAKGQSLQNVPKTVYIEARPTPGTSPSAGGAQ